MSIPLEWHARRKNVENLKSWSVNVLKNRKNQIQNIDCSDGEGSEGVGGQVVCVNHPVVL